MTTRVLVTGASGYLASRLLTDWQSAATVLGVSRTQPSRDLPWRQLDLSDTAAIIRCLIEFRPDAVVHCAAAQAGATDRDLLAVNVRAAETIAAWTSAMGVRSIFVSSDMVHSGDDGPYADTAKPTPLTPYGRSKAAGERLVAAANKEAVIIRTSLIYGLEAIDRGTADMAERLESGQTLTLWSNVIRQPIEIGALSKSIRRLVDEPDVSGVINIAGAEAMSRADFALAMLEYWGYPYERFADQISLVELGSQDTVPIDLRLNCERAGALGLSMPGVSTTRIR